MRPGVLTRKEYEINLGGCTTKQAAEAAGRHFLAERMHTFPSAIVVNYNDVVMEPQSVTVEDDGARYVVAKVAAWLCLASSFTVGIVFGWLVAVLVLVALR